MMPYHLEYHEFRADSRGLLSIMAVGFSCVRASETDRKGFSTFGHGNEIKEDNGSLLLPIVMAKSIRIIRED